MKKQIIEILEKGESRFDNILKLDTFVIQPAQYENIADNLVRLFEQNLKEEIGQYLNWRASETLKELGNDTWGVYKDFSIERSIDKYLKSRKK